MKGMTIAGVALGVSLAGCAELIEAQRRADEAQCVQEGFRPGTDSFRLCRLTIEQIRERRAAEEAQKRRKDDEEAQARRRQQDEDDRRRREEDAKRMSCFANPKGIGCP